MPATTPEEIAAKAATLAKSDDPDAAGRLITEASGDRQVLEAARDRVAEQVHARVDDWEATATLTLLNKALAEAPRHDPLDWRVRWAKHRKP
ncbi:MAG: hypothetical protein ACRDYY_04345 [Acidimicrobiales bacterium]